MFLQKVSYSNTSMLFGFLNCFLYDFYMILNDMGKKVKGQFSKEITLDDDGDDITYIFPNTAEFISILRRKINKKHVLD